MAMQDVMALVLGGGRGTRLYPLTKLRAKPAVPIGGKYRLIDIPISNCLNSGVHKIYVLTQFLSASLHRHIYQTYKFDVFSGGFVYILAAEETPSGMDWYQGTADAVRKQLPRFAHARVEDILILSGDHAPRFGILKTDEDGRITSFHEKPHADELDGLESLPDSDKPYMASMGIYLFRSDVLRKVLEESDAEDFGKQIIPAAIENLRVYAFPFDGYWEDIGTRPTWRSRSLNRPSNSSIPNTPFTPARAFSPLPGSLAVTWSGQRWPRGV